MPDELTPGQPGQGSTETPASGDKDFDYQRGYEQLRPEFTRTTQELSTSRERLSEYENLFEALHDSDPAVQAEAMELLGLEPADVGSPERSGGQEELIDPLEEDLRKANERLAVLEAAREQEATERENQHLTILRDEFIGEAISLIEGSLTSKESPFKFDEREETVLGNLAIAMTGDDGLPDVQGAYKALYGDAGLLEISRSRWIDTKTGAAQAPLGTTIPADKKPTSAADRVAYVDERVAQMNRQQ